MKSSTAFMFCAGVRENAILAVEMSWFCLVGAGEACYYSVNNNIEIKQV